MEYPILVMCRVLEVSTSGYYQWRSDMCSKRNAFDFQLTDLIKVLHAESFGSYGARRIARGLKQQGLIINIKRIRRLMRIIGLKGKGAAKKFVTTTQSNHSNPVATNQLARRFTVDIPNTKWVSDITYIWTKEGWLYLAVVIDLFNRMVVGFATSSRIDASLVCLALQKAIAKRAPDKNLLLHSDRGVQYTSQQYRKIIRKHSIVQSMSRKGDCWDNAVCESFFRALKVEAISGCRFESRSHAESIIFNYIEHFYNSKRLHSFLLYKSPIQFEQEALADNYLLTRRSLFLN